MVETAVKEKKAEGAEKFGWDGMAERIERAQNGIGYLAQEASVFRKMSVEDNIASVLELTNTTPEYQKDKLESS